VIGRDHGGGEVVVAASVAQRPGYGGHAWAILQWVLGLRSIGRRVLLVDRLEPEMCVDAGGRRCAPERSANLRYLRAVMRRFGLDGDWAVLCDGGRRAVGLAREQLLRRVSAAAGLLDVMGFMTDGGVLERCRRRVFVDIDPGYGQMWCDAGLDHPLDGHDAHVTIGENIGRPDCAIPTCGIDWVTTPQPVALEHWTPAPAGAAYTGVASWRGPYGTTTHNGVTYGSRVHEFRSFLPLPRLRPRRFELALDIHPAEERDIAALRDNGWSLVDPRAACGDPDAYRDFIRGSRAEFMVAQQIYVGTRSGWFSDRSTCYLASGKPVLAQDTGFTDRYPSGRGLLAFSTLEEAAAGIDAIEANHAAHAAAAREIAEEYFDARKVLPRVLERVGLG
jgi:hypothetical protein